MSISSLTTPEAQAEAVLPIAARLIGGAVDGLEAIGGGRNSRVYRVTATAGAHYALKAYFQHQADSRDRLWTEFSSLQFLWENGFRDVPQPLAADREQGCALYEYVAGEKVTALAAIAMETAVNFLARLKDLRPQAEGHAIASASEACFSGQALEDILERRLCRLADVPEDEKRASGLGTFLERELLPTFNGFAQWSRTRLSFERELSAAEKTLSPSDFGFHNALKRAKGQFVFLDFEYFGWDDPAKTVCDFLLHPAMALPKDLRREFATNFLARFAEYPQLAERVAALYPLYGLKWCIILLNEFLAEHLLRRQFAHPAARGSDHHSAQAEQLAKARRMLERIAGEYECFPYFDQKPAG